jgi:cytochrome c biogenesis protein
VTDTIIDEEQATPLSTQPAPEGWSVAPGIIPFLRHAWRLLTSMRTALLLLALLALAAIPGTVIPQRNLDPVKVDSYIARHPVLGRLMDHVGLFNVFSSVWFAVIYLALFVSVVGCLVPRIRLHARALRRRPPDAPRYLTKMSASAQWETDESPSDVAERVHRLLRRTHWRADIRAEPGGGVTVAAEKGYLRETGNLVFHVALVLLLIGIMSSALFGYKGTVLVNPGGSFANAREAYDVFEPAKLFSDSQLSPFSFTMQKFTATYQANGEPATFNAQIHYRDSPSSPSTPYDIEVNHPLDVPGAKVFLVGHGYSIRLKVTNSDGRVVSNGDTAFLPDNTMFLSHGVVKIPDLGAKDGELGLTGFFYPTAGFGPTGALTSVFPGDDHPELVLAAWNGNLGLNQGIAESDYSLDVTHLHHLATTTLSPGQSWRLPDGATVTFEGVDQWATFQVAHEPGKTTVLIAAILIVAGLIGSLLIRRRRFWLRAVPGPGGPGQASTVVSAAGLARSDVGGFARELDDLVDQIGRPPPGVPDTGRD